MKPWLYLSYKVSLFVIFLIVISSSLILSSSYELELVLVLVDARVGNIGTLFWIIVLGVGGKANNPGCEICNGAYFGGKLGNKGIIYLGCTFSKDTKVCSVVLAI